MKKICAAALLLLLALPAAGLLGKPLAWDAGDWDAALTERAALHDETVTAWAETLRALTGETGSDQVIGGRDGFLFFGETVGDALGLEQLTEEQIGRIADSLAAQGASLRESGAELVVLLAPNKATIYPDMLPAYMRSSGARGNLDRLQEALAARGVRYVDAKSILRSGRQTALVYHRTDTHWNAFGAGLVARALLAECGAAVDAFPVPEQETPMLGDLARLCMPSLKVSETALNCALPENYRADRPIRSLDAMRIGTTGESGGARLVVVRDSFGEALFPYLANAAERLVYLRGHEIDPAVVAEERPGAVVVEVAERSIPLLLPEDEVAVSSQ